MAATVGAAAVISVSTTLGGTYDEITGAKDAGLDMAIAALETTAFSDTTGSGSNQVFIAGLRGYTGSISGTYQPSDTGQAKIVSVVYGTYTNLFLKRVTDGTNGYKFEVIFTKFSTSPPVDGVVEFTADYTVTGSLTAVP